MQNQTSTVIPSETNIEAPRSGGGCCGGPKTGRMKLLIASGVALLVLGLISGSAILGFAAIAPLLYVLPCLVMCGMCLFMHGGAAKGAE